jgi:hypothetical protein
MHLPRVRAPFRWRRFVTCALVLSFVVAGLSGIVLFIRPEGSLARWVGWSALGADKKQWESLHIASVVLVLVASCVHLSFNWRPFLAAIAAQAHQSPVWRTKPRLELAAALALVGLVTWGSLANSRPFSAVNDLRAAIKDGRFVVDVAPPGENADRLTLEDVCGRISIEPRDAVNNARRHGLVITDTSRTLGAIAREHGVSPEEVYESLGGGQTQNAQP